MRAARPSTTTRAFDTLQRGCTFGSCLEGAAAALVDGEDAKSGSWVHSQARVPVQRTFRAQADGPLRVTETAFAGFGPGLPEVRAGGARRIERGMIVHSADGATPAELRVRVAPIRRHRLLPPSGGEPDLSALRGPGEPSAYAWCDGAPWRLGGHRSATDSHFIGAAWSDGCETRRCQIIGWNDSVWGVTVAGLTVGTTTQASATLAV